MRGVYARGVCAVYAPKVVCAGAVGDWYARCVCAGVCAMCMRGTPARAVVFADWRQQCEHLAQYVPFMQKGPFGQKATFDIMMDGSATCGSIVTVRLTHIAHRNTVVDVSFHEDGFRVVFFFFWFCVASVGF